MTREKKKKAFKTIMNCENQTFHRNQKLDDDGSKY